MNKSEHESTRHNNREQATRKNKRERKHVLKEEIQRKRKKQTEKERTHFSECKNESHRKAKETEICNTERKIKSTKNTI